MGRSRLISKGEGVFVMGQLWGLYWRNGDIGRGSSDWGWGCGGGGGVAGG